MGKTILTPTQFKFLEFAAEDKQITKIFYLTGGTALAEFYLKHRLSEDLDLFTEDAEVNQAVVIAFLKKISPKLGIAKIKMSQFLGLVSSLLIFKRDDQLKVDFNYYPFPRINKGKKYKDLDIDSIYDIAVNKVHTLFMRARPRDYVDLYFIMREMNYPLQKLTLDAKAKFDWDIDRVTLASQFIRVKDFRKDYPKMLKPFNYEDMEKFFISQAKKLAKEIFKS